MNAICPSVRLAARSELVPLSILRAGQAGRVGDVVGTEDVVHRLRELGLFSGAVIEMVRPGSPCIIRLAGQRLGFRTDDVVRVLVDLSAVSP